MTSLKTKTSKSAQLAIFIHVSLLFIHSSLLQDTFAQEKKKVENNFITYFRYCLQDPLTSHRKYQRTVYTSKL